MTSGACIKCKQLKDFLEKNEIPFQTVDMETAEGLSDLFANGVYTMKAPVLQINETFLLTDEMFKGNELRESLILESIKCSVDESTYALS